MARLTRFILPGQPQHVIIRGNNRDPIFLTNQDYSFYLDILKRACDKHFCELHAYVLMTNHVHLLITPNTSEGLSKTIQMIGRYYVQYFNFTYHRTGTLWEGRYKATLIDSDIYALLCYRYLELNPVRANMVKHPADYPWSSYRYNALGENNLVVTPHAQYTALGNNPEQRQEVYRSLFNTHIDEKTLDEIRQATNKSWVLGNSYFKEKIEHQLNRRTTPLPKGGDRKSEAYNINRVRPF
ncbi:MAG: transposase [Pseudomonadota bacterium]